MVRSTLALLLACGNFHCLGSDRRVAELIIHALERGGVSAGQWVGEFCPHCIGLGAPASVNSLPAANLRRMRGQCGLNSRQQAQLGTVEHRRIGVQGPAGRETAMGPPRSPSPPTFSYRVTQLGGLGDAGREGLVPACVLEGRKRPILCGSHSVRNRCHRQCDNGRSVRRSVAGGIEPCPFPRALPRFRSGE